MELEDLLKDKSHLLDAGTELDGLSLSNKFEEPENNIRALLVVREDDLMCVWDLDDKLL